MDEIKRANIRPLYPPDEGLAVQTGVPDIEVGASTPFRYGASEEAKKICYQLTSKSVGWTGDEVEQGCRRPTVQNDPKSLMMDHRLSKRSKVLKIGKTDPIDARGLQSDPATPDQSAYVKQKWRVVGHDKKSLNYRFYEKNRQSGDGNLEVGMTLNASNGKREGDRIGYTILW